MLPTVNSKSQFLGICKRGRDTVSLLEIEDLEDHNNSRVIETMSIKDDSFCPKSACQKWYLKS